MALKADKNKKFSTRREADMKALARKTRAGYDRIYKDEDANGEIWNDRIEKNWSIIAYKKFTSHYLITLIQIGLRNAVLWFCIGGSVNSTVAYCLGIINVDPIDFDLYSERFLKWRIVLLHPISTSGFFVG